MSSSCPRCRGSSRKRTLNKTSFTLRSLCGSAPLRESVLEPADREESHAKARSRKESAKKALQNEIGGIRGTGGFGMDRAGESGSFAGDHPTCGGIVVAITIIPLPSPLKLRCLEISNMFG